MTWVMASRRRVIVVTLVLLALLDLGRSVYARTGYARPVEVWQPDPLVYADLTWPPGADLPAAYAQRCAVCHGPDGRGNGPAAPSMIPRPRDFTRGEFKYKSTPAGEPPSDDDLTRTVRDGLTASAMPAWGDLLNNEEIRAVVAHIKTLSPIFQTQPPQRVAIPPRVAPDSASLARGRVQFLGQCANCHGPDGRAGLLLKDSKGYPVIARDVTAPWTFHGGGAPEEIWLRLTTGLLPGPMPLFAETLTAAERWDVVNYVLSIARTPPWESGGRLDGPGQQTNPVARGRYFIHAMMCGLCHTPIDRTGIYRGDDFYLAGGMRVGAYPHGWLISRNLTSEGATGLGSWTEAEIMEAFQNGRSPGRTLNLFDMPWTWLHRLDPDDASAIARYLNTTLTAVNNRIPAPLRYGVVETIVMKIARGLPAAQPRVLTFADGVFGQPSGGLPRGFPQGLLVGGQWLVLAIGIVAFVFAAPPGSRFPRTRRGRWLGVLGIVGLLFVGLVGVALYGVPGLRIIPPEVLVTAASPEPPRPDPSRFATPEQAALAERGHYMYTVTSCGLCHGPNGAGGAKISWKPMGTLWTRNITPDPDTGIGRWSDAQIARAIRSGVAADGRMLHWQGMIWDHLSNLDEEDVRALVAYLRTLPPVRRQIPSARPPRAR
jgi:cytochrome c oxidase cbb3-type subunit 2